MFLLEIAMIKIALRKVCACCCCWLLFPNVLGCLDGNLEHIKKLAKAEDAYVYRQVYHANNVHGICSRWQGYTHDAFI